jgi:tetratricopeptide (TPR) repeat protein
MVTVMAFAWGQPGWSAQDDPRLDDLFALLADAENPERLGQIEQSIWILWLDSGDDGLNQMMQRGVSAMNQGDFPIALAAFNSIIEAAPDFAEGWNKRATLYWLMGDYQASIDDIDKTLALEPRHFGALSGLAMIRSAQERHEDAYQALKKMLTVHPHSPGVRERLKALENLLGTDA